MKKIISFVLAFAMCASITTSYAANLKDTLKNELGVATMDELTRDIPVPTDISLKTESGTEFVNGPLNLRLSEAQNTKFGFKASIDMDEVITRYNGYTAAAALLVAGDSALEAELASCTVDGQFIITVDYPTVGCTVNPAAKTDTAMVGFTSDNNRHLEIFEETVARDVTTDGRIVITVDVKDNIGIQELSGALSDLHLTYNDNIINAIGTYTVKGSVSGWTTINSTASGEIGKITYLFNQKVGGENAAQYRNPNDATDISATVIVTSDSTGTSLGGGSAQVELVFVDKDGELHKKTYKPGSVIDLSDLEKPSKPGKVFAGYFYDEELTKPVETSITLNKDTKIYCKWIDEALNTDDHFAFIIGYPEENGREEVRPEINMTREEIATVFYRLLKDDVRDSLFTNENDFPDVDVERWSNKAISTMAKGGYVNGYEDGTFRPGAPITRAEFVTIAARFYAVDEDAYTADAPFTDVDGHWAEKYIKYATSCGWINGYEDNTFRPDRYITRAEVMKIINHMLDRAVNEEGLVEDAKRWVDNSADKWYYYEVIEATNFHAYEKAEDAEFETWTGILENEILVDKAEYEDA